MSNEKEQTPVEWYAIEMAEYLRSMYGDGIINLDILRKAKELEKQRIIKAVEDTIANIKLDEDKSGFIAQNGEGYYKQTYESDL
jgi:ribosomal protein S19E (S16A)